MTIQCPTPKILLPVDGSDNSRRAVEFTGCLCRLMEKSLSGITLLHVIASSYLGKHTDYVDFRSEIIKQSDAIKKMALIDKVSLSVFGKIHPIGQVAEGITFDGQNRVNDLRKIIKLLTSY